MNEFSSFPFFAGLRIRHLSLLIKCASRAEYKAGETLFAQGAAAFRLFLIKSGSVSLEGECAKTGMFVRRVAIAGDVLAQSCVEKPANWPRTARAIEDTKAIVLSGARLMACAEEFPDFGAELAKRGLQRRLEAVSRSEDRGPQDDHPTRGLISNSSPKTRRSAEGSPLLTMKHWIFRSPARNVSFCTMGNEFSS